jgi:hypothetical protein
MIVNTIAITIAGIFDSNNRGLKLTIKPTRMCTSLRLAEGDHLKNFLVISLIPRMMIIAAKYDAIVIQSLNNVYVEAFVIDNKIL